MKKIELQRNKLRDIIQSSGDLTREDVLRISQDLDQLILEAQALLAEEIVDMPSASDESYVRAI